MSWLTLFIIIAPKSVIFIILQLTLTWCTHPSIVFSPALDIFVWIRPQQVTQKPCVRNIGGSHDPSDLLHALEIRTQTSVATEDLLVHNGGDGETVETVGECFPQFDVVASLACQNRKCKETAEVHGLRTYIHHKNRKSCWWKHTRGCLVTRRSSQDTWSCRPAADKSSPGSVCLQSPEIEILFSESLAWLAHLCPRSLQERDN